MLSDEDSSPEEPLAPQGTGRPDGQLRQRSDGRFWTKLVFESIFIVLSIVGALAVDSWREGIRDRELALRAVSSFERELKANEASIKRLLPYHDRLQGDFRKLAAAGTVKTVADLDRIPDFRGFNPPFLLDTAWQTAVATGALTKMDYALVEAMSKVYTLQRVVAVRSEPSFMLTSGAFSEANLQSTVLASSFYLADMTSGERELLNAYRDILPLLEQRRKEGGKTSSAPVTR
jgi:hypothetical protein